MKNNYELGIVGLGVMGMSLARNMTSKGIHVLGYDTQRAKTHEAQTYGLATTGDLNTFMESLPSPRRILVMVPAGQAVDDVLRALKPYLKKGDSVADGGNSFFKTTTLRQQQLAKEGVHFLGLGISGGRRGALEGPGMMAGGSAEGYAIWKEVLEKVAARFKNEPCVTYLGKGGAGHYVKMVHNGIEYGLMQLLAEAYILLKTAGQVSPGEIASVFREWSQGILGGFLTEITADILERKDSDGTYWIDDIIDVAAQKGTGNWTVQNSLELGIPIPGIDVAVRQRQISAFPNIRHQLKKYVQTEEHEVEPLSDLSSETLAHLLYTCQLLVFIQGVHLLAQAKEAYDYSYELTEIARIWRGGCIISSKLVEFLASLPLDAAAHPLLIPEISDVILKNTQAIRTLIPYGQKHGLPLSCLSANLDYWLSFTSETMPTQMIQAQRDYFGGHGLQTKSGRHQPFNWDNPTS